MRSRSTETGLSVLEVTIIVLVIAALAAIAIPNFQQATLSYNIQIAANALSQQLNRCRQEAVRANLPLKIRVAAHSTSIDLNRDNDFTNDADLVSLGEDATVTLVTPTDGVVEYSSRGEMRLGVAPEFRVGANGRYRRVTIDPRGAVTVHSEEAE